MQFKTKQSLLVAVVSVSLFAALMNLSVVLGVLRQGFGLVLPVVAGSVLALFLNIPMNAIEKQLRRLLQGSKKQPSDRLLHILSFVTAIICIFMVLAVVLVLLVPQVIRSGKSLYAQIEANIPQWVAYLDTQPVQVQWLEDLLAHLDAQQIMQRVSDGVDLLIPNIVGALSSTVSTVITAAFSLIVCIYMTLSKQQLCRHAVKLVTAYLKPSWSRNILRFCRMFHRSFAAFLSGQCCEAVILGTLMFLAFSVFGLPYGNLVGVLTAVCAIIPYVGAFISCAVSVLLTLLIDPSLAIRCLAVYGVVQFIENQLIYPRVVGNSVGLPPIYTLVAAMVGGKLFGILGIIFFIPLAAVLLALVREDVSIRLQSHAKAEGQQPK